MKVQIGVSNRHIHLTKEAYEILCGNKEVEVKKMLKQPGQFASTQTFTIKTEKGEITNVRLLGPIRDYTQIEISKTDAYKLGLNPPIRKSGDLEGSDTITIVGPNGSITTSGVIIAERHIHISEDALKYYHLEGKDTVNVLIPGEKGGIMSNVHLKVSKDGYFEFHIDTDDANAFLLKSDDIVEIVEE